MDSSLKNQKFGVVHTSPTEMLTKNLEVGKLYFAQGDASGAAKQGIYALTNSSDVDGVNELTMFGTGAIADGNGYGLSQANFTTTEKNKLEEFGAASTYLTVANASTNYLKIKDASYFRTVKVGTTSIVADSSKDTLEFVAGSNVTITPDATNDKITISATDTVYTHPVAGSPTQSLGTTGGGTTVTPGTLTKIATVYDASFDASGHYKGKVAKDISINVAKPSTAGVADEAKKTTGTLTFKVNGTNASAFNGSANTSIDISAGTNISISEASDGVINISTSGVPTTTEMNNAIQSALTSALKYKGTVDGSASKLPTTHTAGDVYVASASFETTAAETGNAYKVESGDYFISNGTIFNVVNGENQVSDASATLTPGSTNLKLATVDGTDITVNVPALPSIVNTLNGKSGALTTSYDTSISSTTNGAYRAGTLTIAGKTHIIYGKDTDTVYVHPALDANASTAITETDEGNFAFSSSTNTLKVITGGQRDASGHVSKLLYTDVTLPATAYSDTVYTHPAAGTGSVDTPTNSSTAATLLTRVKIDASGHVTDTTAFNGNVGGTTTPIYFKEGIPTALGYTIAKSVPSDAIFTDTKVTANTSTGTIYLIGQDDATSGTTEITYKNEKVYMSGGALYANSASVAANATALVSGGVVYNAVQTAKSEAIEAATIYWETL